MDEVRQFVDGSWRDGSDTFELVDPYTLEVVGEVASATVADIGDAVSSAAIAARQPLHPAERAGILERVSDLVSRRSDDLVRVIVAESGFTVADARGEVRRATSTLKLCAEEATRITGEMVPLDSSAGVTQRLAFTIRTPIGVVCAITPFNSPLNTVAHKLGPAIAAGNAVILKPASKTPATAAMLVELLLEAGLRPDLIQLLHGHGSSVGAPLLQDRRIDAYTFTGSTATGEEIARTIGLRPAQLELGAVSPTLVLPDADLDLAIAKIPPAAFRKAGQVCTSVQRLFVAVEVLHPFVERLVDATNSMRAGDPRVGSTSVGPMISPAEADRVQRWVAEAVAAGAEQLSGGRLTRSVIEPIVILRPPADGQLAREEVFGPVLTIEPFESLTDAVADINAGPFGLATGIFTRDLGTALEFAHRVRMGSVHVNETSSSRVDSMPYGGVKQSGRGREGPRYAIRELTEERLVTMSYGGRQ